MTASRAESRAAFAALRRALVRRRWSAIEPRLRVEIALIALLSGGFLFWQARVAFASFAHDHGPLPVVLAASIAWAALAGSGALLAAVHHARQLGAVAPGPAWLALPIPPAAILDHLEWEARSRAWWMAPAAPALLVALLGLVPAVWIVGLAPLFALLLEGASRAGVRVAFVFTRGREGRGARLDAVTRRLVVVARPAPRAGRGRDRPWRRASPWRALWNKDFLLARRPSAARRVALPLLIGALSVAAWRTPLEPAAARVMAFGLALVAAYSWGEWLIALAGEDPFGILRALPVRLRDVWLSRAAWGALATIALAIGHAAAARALSPAALELFLIWSSAATVLLSVLAIHYGITLYPDERTAQRVYTLTLGIAVAASLMIPLMGWITLLAAVLHSSRRLHRWSRLDPTE
jgi:hypothetical protein